MNTDVADSCRDIRGLFSKLWFAERGHSALDLLDYEKRDIVCTPFSGNYGDVAGWVICVNGSPPKGTFFVYFGGSGVWGESDFDVVVVYIGRGIHKRVNAGSNYIIIRDFVNACLSGSDVMVF